jgi:demethylmenaquinone methyltransferase/2-methoxy-6-polyprenyl-1,4-benzoquinol methylase
LPIEDWLGTGMNDDPGAVSPSRLPLESSLDRPETKRQYNRRLFATIAGRYDIITRLLSFGQDRRWKTRVIRLCDVKPGRRVLDLACGTGDLTFGAAAKGARVTGLDLTPGMIELARQKPAVAAMPATWVVGDMCALPIADEAFDIVTTGYGLRNVPDLAGAIAEIVRVLKPGGQLCSLDFDRPEARWLRSIYLGYLSMVGSALGWVLHRDPDTYRYIPASIRRYPGARRVSAMLVEAGFTNVRHIQVLGGLMAIHMGAKGPHQLRTENSEVRTSEGADAANRSEFSVFSSKF